MSCERLYIIILYGIYLKGSGIGVPGHFQIVVEKSAFMAYNMLNKTADKEGQVFPFRQIITYIEPLILPGQSGSTYFSSLE